MVQIHPESKESFLRRLRPSEVPGADERYFVPDLSPRDRDAFRGMKPRWIFVAESPHVNEVEPEQLRERRPLCGMAGRQWWALLSEILEGEASEDVSLPRLLEFCLRHQVVVMNAVQYPLDPKIMVRFPAADPIRNLGFCKATGPYYYKKLKHSAPVQNALASLQARLEDPSLGSAPIYCLGNDAEWFLQRLAGVSGRCVGKIPHPSAWWRKGGYFGKVARQRLVQILAGSS